MNTKSLIWLGVVIGSAVGGWLPTLWGAGFFSMTSVITTAIGGIAGLWLGFKLSQWLE